jgi:hypothetical protein
VQRYAEGVHSQLRHALVTDLIQASTHLWKLRCLSRIATMLRIPPMFCSKAPDRLLVLPVLFIWYRGFYRLGVGGARVCMHFIILLHDMVLDLKNSKTSPLPTSWSHTESEQVCSFTSPAVDGGELSAYKPGRFTQGKNTVTRWIWSSQGPRTGLGVLEKRINCLCRDTNPSLCQRALLPLTNATSVGFIRISHSERLSGDNRWKVKW